MQKVCLTIFQLEACWIYPSLGNGNTWMAWEKCIWRKNDMDAMFILFQVPLINKNGTKSMHCIIRGKFVISPCRKSALFWIHAVILLFHAEILPCGPPLLPHSCAEPFLGVVQKYSFPGDIFTSATWSVYRYSHWPVFSFWRQLDVVVFEGWSRTRSARVAAAPARSLLSSASLHLSSPGSSWSYIFGL